MIAWTAGAMAADAIDSGTRSDLVAADMAAPADASSLLPSFLDVESMQQLQSALFQRSAAGSPDAAREVLRPGDGGATPFAGASAFAGGLTFFLPEVLRSSGRSGDAALTTADFSRTLLFARRDTGEARMLADEVRRRAEEISRRFAAGAWEKPAAAGNVDSDGSSEPATTLAAAATDADNPANLLAPPPQHLETAEGSSTPAAAGEHRPAVEREQRMALGHGAGEDGGRVPASSASVDSSTSGQALAAAGIEIAPPSLAPAAAPAPMRKADVAGRQLAKRRLPGMAHPDQHRPATRAVATARAGLKVHRVTTTTAVIDARGAASTKPPIVKSAGDVASVTAATGAASKPAGGGGLFSFLKPLSFPTELQSLGWAKGD